MPRLPATSAPLGPPCPPTAVDFDAWYEAHFDYVWRSLKRLGIRSADLPDVTHDVFVVAWRQRTHFDETRPVRPWLFGVSFRVASVHRRRAWFRYAWTKSEVEQSDWRPGPERNAIVRAELATLQRALDQVPLKQRAVLLLHDFDEVSVADIATTLGLPVKTVYSRLDAGRKHFRQAYRQQELSRSPVEPKTAAPGDCR